MIDQFVFSKKLGQVMVAPVDVFLDEYSAPQPDLIFISKARKSIITEDGIMGAPDLVIEIISPSSMVRDRVEKMKLYQQFKITEYWLVDPANKSVEIYMLDEKGQYAIHAHEWTKGKVKSSQLKNFELEIKGLFS